MKVSQISCVIYIFEYALVRQHNFLGRRIIWSKVLRWCGKEIIVQMHENYVIPRKN